MTNEFIKAQCVNCDKCIFERDCGHYFYPYPTPNDYIPMYCGSITEFGCHGIPLTDLEYCPKVNKDIKQIKDMTTEDRDLLMKDLCSRLPYKVRCKCVSGLGGGETEKGVLKYVGNCYGVISNYYEDVPLHSGFVNNVFYPIENVKPYLRLISSVTKKEKKEYDKLRMSFYKNAKDASFVLIDWLNAHHFDYRGLIEKGLALEAPEGMYQIQ